MIRTALRKYAPESLCRLVHTAYHSATSASYAQLVALGDCFPSVEKKNRVASRTIPTPEVPAMTFKEDARHLQGYVYTVPEDFTAVLNQVLVSPVYNVALTSERDVVSESSNAGKPIFFNKKTLSLRKERPIAGNCALLRSRFDNYYHLLVDFLPRLLALEQEPYSELTEIKLLCPGGVTATEQFFLDRLALKNVQVVPLDAQYLYRAERLIITPIKTQWQSGYIPKRYVELLRRRLWPQKASSEGGRRLFISREKAGRRIMTNRAQVMDMLRPLGFERVVMEDLSPEEQVKTLHEAGAVVATHGAGLTNTLFARPGLKIVEIFPTHYVTPHYFYLSKALGHEYTYQCGSGDDIQVQTFEADLTALQASLSRLDIT